ncbi:hypothetical protein F9C07_2072275, partial [Aspergillus flavus]
CSSILDYLVNSRYGTSSINKHIKDINCRKSTIKRPNIKQLLEKVVYLLLSIKLSLNYILIYISRHRIYRPNY